MTTMPLPATDYVPVLRGLTAGFAETLAAGDLTAPVPYCAGWTLKDLGTHLGNVHRWAADLVTTGELQPRSFTDEPSGELVAWYTEGAGLLLDALAVAVPEEPCWVFGATANIKAFWFRRQVHETAVHLIDAHGAVGTELAPDPVIDADGVDEVLTAMLPRVTRWHAQLSLPAPVSLRATDTGDTWTVHPGEPVMLGPDTGAAATVEATARELLVLLWKRGTLDEAALRITGDEALAKAFLASPMTP